ncbi:MAG: glycosyltransferase, partial [Myxococcales bacterium]|nr:glycosyltransferase [Myxococcales bacterium]
MNATSVDKVSSRTASGRLPLSICHVLWSVEVGGAERVVLDLARAQRADGHRVSVVTLSNVRGAMAAEFQGVVDTLEAVPKWRGTDLSLPLRLARWFRRYGADVVHTHNELPLIYGAPGGKLARAAVVHSKHG